MARNSAAGPGRIEDDLARLASLDLAGVRRRWRQVFGHRAPEHLPHALLQRTLAYRIQANAIGDLDRETAKALDRLSREGESVIPLPELRGTLPGPRFFGLREKRETGRSKASKRPESRVGSAEP